MGLLWKDANTEISCVCTRWRSTIPRRSTSSQNCNPFLSNGSNLIAKITIKLSRDIGENRYDCLGTK